jgi:hypothetical protein
MQQLNSFLMIQTSVELEHNMKPRPLTPEIEQIDVTNRKNERVKTQLSGT